MADTTSVAVPAQPVTAEFVALSPYEVADSIAGMRAWAASKINEMRGQRIELEATLAAAERNKWTTAPFRRQVDLAKKREEFYLKIDKALEAGYLVVPNFPMTVFAVRTKRVNPDGGAVEGRWASVPDVRPQVLPAGEGRYVSVRPETETFKNTEEKDGKEIERTYQEAVAFIEDPVATFPIALVKPRIIDVTQRALAQKLFDEIGVADGTSGRRGDPFVLGRILNPRRFSQNVTFFLAWTADLRRI